MVRAIALRAVAVAVGLVLTVAGLELALQLGALAVRATSNAGVARAGGWLTGRRTVLCLGDSNTYGLYVERREAWPAQLAALWTASGGKPEIDVLNLGVPGNSSSSVLRHLNDALEQLRPDVVIVLIGVNDFWTVPVGAPPARGGPGVIRRFAARHSRLYRLLYMLRRSADTAEVEIERSGDVVPRVRGTFVVRVGEHRFEMGFERASGEAAGTTEDLERNLREIVATVRDSGVGVLLLSYATDLRLYRAANAVIADVARATGTPFLPLRAVFAEPCPADGCPGLFHADRTHPRPEGHRLVAEAVAARLPELLRP